MGANLERYTSREREFYKIGFYAGISATWRKCRACGAVIKSKTPIIAVHSFGEIPSFFHPDCSEDIITAMKEVTASLEELEELL